MLGAQSVGAQQIPAFNCPSDINSDVLNYRGEGEFYFAPNSYFGVAGLQSWFIAGGVVAGFGLGSLLGAPFRYIVLNEAAPEERASAQGLLTVFAAVGQLLGAAIVGGVAASRGGGEAG